jgi:hypothetical protein
MIGDSEGMWMVIEGKGEGHRAEAEVVSSNVTTRRSTSSNMSIVDLHALCPAQTGDWCGSLGRKLGELDSILVT